MSGRLSSNSDYNEALEFETQIQIGSKLFPEYPIRGITEQFAQLRKCMGVHASTIYSFAILPKMYRAMHYIIGFDAEKVLEAGYTGLNTKNGDLMLIRVKALNQGAMTQNRMPDEMQVVLHSDQILDISDAGTQVFD